MICNIVFETSTTFEKQGSNGDDTRKSEDQFFARISFIYVVYLITVLEGKIFICALNAECVLIYPGGVFICSLRLEM